MFVRIGGAIIQSVKNEGIGACLVEEQQVAVSVRYLADNLAAPDQILLVGAVKNAVQIVVIRHEYVRKLGKAGRAIDQRGTERGARKVCVEHVNQLFTVLTGSEVAPHDDGVIVFSGVFRRKPQVRERAVRRCVAADGACVCCTVIQMAHVQLVAANQIYTAAVCDFVRCQGIACDHAVIHQREIAACVHTAAILTGFVSGHCAVVKYKRAF